MVRERVVCVGDHGGYGPPQRKVAKAMKTHCEKHCEKEGCIFLSQGDVAYSPPATKQFEDPTLYGPLLQDEDSVFLICRGNHDLMKNPDDTTNSDVLLEYSKETKGKVYFPEPYYHYELPHANMDVFVIDTNFKEANYTEKDIQQQLETMKDLISASTQPWKMVCGHHTWRSVGGHGNADPQLETFLQTLFTECKTPIDIYICGHDHCRCITEVTLPNGRCITTIVNGAGGAPYTYDHEGYTDYQQVLGKPDSKLLFYCDGFGFMDVREESKTSRKKSKRRGGRTQRPTKRTRRHGESVTTNLACKVYDENLNTLITHRVKKS